MKKIIIILLTSLNIILANDIIHFDNQNVLDNLRLAGFNSITHNIKQENLKNILAEYYLLCFEPKKFHKNIYNEFERENLLITGFNTLKLLAKKNYTKYINKNYFTYIWIDFGKYNFKKHFFPLTLITGIPFRIDKHFYNGIFLKLEFDNLSWEDEKLKINLNNAKNLISLHTDSYGNIKRKLIAKYYFKIKSINLTIPGWSLSSSNSSKTLVTAKVKKIEIIDPLQNNKISYTINKE